MKFARAPRRGRLRHLVTIESRRDTRGAHGSSRPTWVTATTRWSKIEPVGGFEGVRGTQMTADATHLVTIDYYKGLTRAHRFVLGSRVFNIALIKNVQERNIVQECECTEETT